MYVFEILNSHDYLYGSKPKLREVGPFVFTCYTKRFNLTYTDNYRKLTYYQRLYYVFDRESSVGELNTPITTINFPLNVSLFKL